MRIGEEVWIGYDSIIETGRPDLVTIGNRVRLGIRTIILAVNREQRGVTIEDDVAIGAGSIVLANVTIGQGSVVTAGSVRHQVCSFKDDGTRESCASHRHGHYTVWTGCFAERFCERTAGK